MVLNDYDIESKRMLGENFLPFQNVWEQLEEGLYQEFIRTYCKGEPLTDEILSFSEWLLNGNAKNLPKRNCQKEYQKFVQDNQEQMKALEAVAKNEKQTSVLYLCVLMHIHAEHGRLDAETEKFIRKLLKDREITLPETGTSGEPEIYRQQFGVIDGEAYFLDGNGRIVSQRGGRPLSMAKDLQGLRSFAYTDQLGLIIVNGKGQVQTRGGMVFVDVPSDTKMASVSAYLSNYMLLDENGGVHTNMNMDLSDWTDLRYIYVGLNSAAGVKRWSGDVVTVGVGKIPALTNVIRICTYHHGEERHYIALLANGEMRSDRGEKEEGVSAIALGEDGYYYAKESGRAYSVYKRAYNEEKVSKEKLYREVSFRVKELVLDASGKGVIPV